MRRPFLPVILTLGMLAAACGDDGGSLTVPTTAAPTTAAPTTAPPATLPPETTAPPATLPPETTATTGAPAPTARDSLDAFLAAAVDLDARIRSAAQVFNAGLDSEAVTIDPSVGPVLDALDATPLRYVIPAGMSPDLEVAVLAVFADLDSRISALQGGWRNIAHAGNLEWGFDCLAYGGTSADRFPADLQRAEDLAASEPPPSAAADSVEAGVLMVRLEAIQSMNWGCDSCGGVQYDEAFPVDWEGRTLLGGVEFEATFGEQYWEILIHAC